MTKKDGKCMVTKETVVELIRHAHSETVHGGEKKTQNKLLESTPIFPEARYHQTSVAVGGVLRNGLGRRYLKVRL